MTSGPPSPTDERKARIKAIAIQIVTSQAARGEVDVDNEAELRAAMKRAVADARETYDAAVEFVS